VDVGAAVTIALLARRGARIADAEGVAPVADPPSTLFRWLPLFLAAGILLAPSFWVHWFNVTHAVPDAELSFDNFKFMAETGQHLAWADALREGRLHGRDFFCLYGPLYDLGIVGVWSAFGRSVAGVGFYLACTRVLGWACLFLAVAALVRRKPVLLVAPFLLPYVKLRVGLALLAFCLFAVWLRTGRRSFAAGAGVVTGASLLFSQEFGLAFALAALVGFAIRRAGQAAALFGAGLLVPLVVVFGWYAHAGALVEMLRDIAAYPGYVIAGYANLPYPGLVPALPLDLGGFGRESSTFERFGYALPLVYVAAAALAIDVGRFDVRRPLVSARAAVVSLAADPVRLAAFTLAVFGGISFRSALGRSDLGHLQGIAPAAVALLCLAFDRLFAALGEGGAARRIAGARVALLAVFVVGSGFVETAAPIESASRSVRSAARLAVAGYEPAGSRRVLRVVRWVQLNTAPGEPVLFLPENAAYYYLTGRASPIRFVLGSQIIGDEHRAEVLADLEARPPRYIVWDHDALVVDGIPHEQVYGAELLDFFDANYVIETRLGTIEILRRVGAPAGRP